MKATVYLASCFHSLAFLEGVASEVKIESGQLASGPAKQRSFEATVTCRSPGRIVQLAVPAMLFSTFFFFYFYQKPFITSEIKIVGTPSQWRSVGAIAHRPNAKVKQLFHGMAAISLPEPST